MSCHIMSCHVMSCHVMSYLGVLCVCLLTTHDCDRSRHTIAIAIAIAHDCDCARLQLHTIMIAILGDGGCVDSVHRLQQSVDATRRRPTETVGACHGHRVHGRVHSLTLGPFSPRTTQLLIYPPYVHSPTHPHAHSLQTPIYTYPTYTHPTYFHPPIHPQFAHLNIITYMSPPISSVL